MRFKYKRSINHAWYWLSNYNYQLDLLKPGRFELYNWLRISNLDKPVLLFKLHTRPDIIHLLFKELNDENLGVLTK